MLTPLSEEKRKLGLRMLRGESTARLCREAGKYGSSIAIYAERVVLEMPGFSMCEYIEQLRKPGVGRIKAARLIYAKLAKGET